MPRALTRDTVLNKFWKALDAVFTRINDKVASDADAKIVQALGKELLQMRRGDDTNGGARSETTREPLDLSDLEKNFDEYSADSE